MADLLINVGATDAASDKFRAIGKAASGLGSQVENAGKKGASAGDGTAKGFLKAQVAFALAAKGIQAFTRFIGDGIKAVMDEEKAVEEMRKAYGAAAGSGKTLTATIGEMKEAQLALSKALAEFIFKSETGIGVVKRFTDGFKAAAEFFSLEGKHDRDMVARTNERTRLQTRLLEIGKSTTAEAQAERESIRQQLADLDQKGKLAQANLFKVIEGRREAEKAKALGFGPNGDKDAKKRREDAKKERERAQKEAIEQEQEFDALVLETNNTINNAVAEAEQEAYEKRLEEQKKFQDEYWKKWQDEMKQREAEIQQLATVITSSFGQYLEQGLTALAKGEEFDFGGAVINILKTAVSAAISAIPFFGPILAPIASAVIGGFGAAATSAGRAHSGAWADNLPRFHSGGEVPAMLLPGERVLSHREIRNMGGPQQVDSMARGQGGGGNTFVINTLDARSFQQRVNEDIGSAIVRAAKTNKGEFSQAFRKIAGVY